MRKKGSIEPHVAAIREKVRQFIVQGMSSKEIAASLKISHRLVRTHMEKISEENYQRALLKGIFK